MGTKTMQIHSKDTNAGIDDLRSAVDDGLFHGLALLQVIIDALDGHCRFVHQNADGQREAAQGHDVQRLADRRRGHRWPPRIDRGIEVVTMSVERQLPRNKRIIKLVKRCGDDAFPYHTT